jgi:hypothetical protein
MKKIMTLAIGLLMFSVQGVASDKMNALVIRGQILETTSIDYKISLIDTDQSYQVVKTGQALKFYKIILETGRNYKITFTKGEFSKTLIVKADSRGIFPVDIDFSRTSNAELFYDYQKGKYNLKVLPSDYAQTN